MRDILTRKEEVRQESSTRNCKIIKSLSLSISPSLSQDSHYQFQTKFIMFTLRNKEKKEHKQEQHGMTNDNYPLPSTSFMRHGQCTRKRKKIFISFHDSVHIDKQAGAKANKRCKRKTATEIRQESAPILTLTLRVSQNELVDWIGSMT